MAFGHFALCGFYPNTAYGKGIVTGVTVFSLSQFAFQCTLAYYKT
jgi:hypothetical protein